METGKQIIKLIKALFDSNEGKLGRLDSGHLVYRVVSLPYREEDYPNSYKLLGKILARMMRDCAKGDANMCPDPEDKYKFVVKYHHFSLKCDIGYGAWYIIFNDSLRFGNCDGLMVAASTMKKCLRKLPTDLMSWLLIAGPKILKEKVSL